MSYRRADPEAVVTWDLRNRTWEADSDADLDDIPALTRDLAYVLGSPTTWYVRVPDGSWLNLSDSGGSPAALAVTSDPVSPVDQQWWFFLDGGSPESVSFRIRRGGTTYEIPIGTLL